MSIDDVQEMIRGENKTYVNVLAKSSSGKRIYKIQREPINLRKVAKNKNFENHWLQVVPQAYRQAEFFSIVPQYSNNLKSEFNTRIHYKSIQRSINIPENRIRYTSGIYSIKAGLPSVGEVFKVSIQ